MSCTSAGSTRDLRRGGRYQQDWSWSGSGSEARHLALQQKQDRAPYTNWCDLKPLFPQRHTAHSHLPLSESPSKHPELDVPVDIAGD